MTLDMSSELNISAYKNGIKLSPPVSRNHQTLTVADVMSLPLNVYFLNAESRYQSANERMVETLKFLSLKDCIGKSVSHIFNKNSAQSILYNDRTVITSGEPAIREEFGVYSNDKPEHALSIKLPWFNDEDKIVGIIGFSFLLGNCKMTAPIRNALSQFVSMRLVKSKLIDNFLYHGDGFNSVNFTPIEMNIINLMTQQTKIDDISNRLNLLPDIVEFYLENIKMKSNTASSKTDRLTQITSRQKECLFYLVKGLTAKQIAIQTGISPRTVEHCIEAMKIKLNCETRAELIIKGAALLRNLL